jgi:hypothetical protein
MAVQPPGLNPRAVDAAAEAGRSAFVDLLLNDFVETTGVYVPEAVRTYILNVVLVTDEEWERGRLADELDAQRTFGQLNAALQLVIGRHGNQFPSIDEVNTLFHESFINACWFPFLIC